ncbi:hypothetical protein CC78DRAFT_580342 [Lojkania enalia]|uniref:Uncharacterized protein n=1 Tax=Lojkania enalia TaxID=147567 RepID=A0A9P4KB53_9PLEO|nr:hypothetical protein CC78DRAFT_580342 [Didymosphaeria enalia]
MVLGWRLGVLKQAGAGLARRTHERLNASREPPGAETSRGTRTPEKADLERRGLHNSPGSAHFGASPGIGVVLEVICVVQTTWRTCVCDPVVQQNITTGNCFPLSNHHSSGHELPAEQDTQSSWPDATRDTSIWGTQGRTGGVLTLPAGHATATACNPIRHSLVADGLKASRGSLKAGTGFACRTI